MKSLRTATGRTPRCGCGADILVGEFTGHSCPVFQRATGKSPELAGWKACATKMDHRVNRFSVWKVLR